MVDYEVVRVAFGTDGQPISFAPERATPGSAGFDLKAAISGVLAPGLRMLVPTGLRLRIPRGMEGQVRPRSGMALKRGVTVLNAPGTIDSDYRGEVGVILVNLGSDWFSFEAGDRIAQIVFAAVADVALRKVDSIEAGRGGFGSTGK